MKTIGLTGGVGMGKSAADSLLRRRGFAVIDTDLLARELVQPGQPALKEIIAAFGEKVVQDDGHLNRRELAGLVFASKEARERLESILHPGIRDLWKSQVESWKLEGKTLAFVIIPLLFETQAEKEVTATICVACSAPTQEARLATRGWSPEQIRQRVDSQLPIRDKMARSDFVLWNESSLEVLDSQLEMILKRIA